MDINFDISDYMLIYQQIESHTKLICMDRANTV